MTAPDKRPLGPADDALLAAEREIAGLRQEEADLIAAGDRGTLIAATKSPSGSPILKP
jgi:hypothetical protein